MRKIEQAMVKAIHSVSFWKCGNTEVHPSGDVYLHGNHIASVAEDGSIKVNTYTLSKWPTPTTKSRLRALGVNVTTKNGVTYLDGVAI